MSRDLDGSSGKVDGGSVPALDGAVAMTVACWTYPDNLGSPTPRACMVSNYHDGGANSGWSFDLAQTSGLLRFEQYSNGSATAAAVAATAGAWQYVAAVRSSGNMRFIKVAAGVLSAENVSMTNGLNGSNSFYVGWIRDQGSFYLFNGKICEVSVWIGSSLTDDEIRASAFHGPLASGHKPTLYWPLRGLASPEPDLSGNKYNGTPAGTCPQSDHAPVGRNVPHMIHAGMAL